MTIAKTLLYAECILLPMMLLSMIASRLQLLPAKIAVVAFALATLLAAIAAVVALILFLMSFSGMAPAARTANMAAFILGVLPVVVIVILVGAGFGVPRIHDISTNPLNNLSFTHAHKLRKEGENSLEPPNTDVVSQQLAYYPHIKPFIIAGELGVSYRKCLRAASQLGWTVVYENESLLQFEATEKTAMFGFVDDIVVKVSAAEGGSQVDMRSVSRVGVSDLGANAKRIARFQRLVQTMD